MNNLDFKENPSKISIAYLKKNLLFLGEGISRLVFALNDYFVLKVAKSSDGLMQNFIENYVYINSSNTLKKYLCPVIFYNKRYLIMLRTIPYLNIYNDKFIDISKLRDEATAEKDILLLANNFDLFKDDLEKISSWGILNNQCYLIDYGCNNPSSDEFYNNLIIK
ncbi:MAG: hypothetical protein Q4B63_00335 [Clostridium perfringens]|nr:hypothetical protein [Clostridium perfringens]